MKTKETANKLVEFCRKGENQKAYEQLFDKNAVGIEPEGSPQGKTQGLDNLKQKSRQFGEDLKEMHSVEISDPLVADKFFSCSMKMDITSKSRGRMQMEEICLYEVNDDGKITKEQFFYSMPGQA